MSLLCLSPANDMGLISSPLAYPPTSSPRFESPRKRRRVDDPRPPLLDVGPNVGSQTFGGFVMDDSDEEVQIPGKPPSGSVGNADTKAPTPEAIAAQAEDQYVDIASQSDGPASRDSNTSPPSANAVQHQPASQVPVFSKARATATSCSGKTFQLRARRKGTNKSYEEIVAARSVTGAGRAHKSYFGIAIHELIEEAKQKIEVKEKEQQVEVLEHAKLQFCEPQLPTTKSLLWTEKYRARKFTDLVGDERTHRSVLRWLKAWDTIVFPGAAKPKPKPRYDGSGAPLEERAHRKILLLTGPPGLGKTTLAHVCAKQAGYEIQEINASDERSRDVVKNRIRDMVGTENVRPVQSGSGKKVSRPVCVVVDEVDGVVTGNSASGGEGGFIKALADLLAVDARNSSGMATQANTDTRRKKKGDSFRLLRPIILICNDVYHPSLSLLRQGTMAEIVYVRKPALNMLVPRLQAIFMKEGVPCDSDGVRQLCEAAWGVSSRREDKAAGGATEGDVRGVLVVAEWVASKIKNASGLVQGQARLTKRWIEDNMLKDLAHGGGATRSLGRAGSKEIVERVFTHNAGFPAGPSTAQEPKRDSTVTLTAAETAKKRNLDRLRELIESSGEDDRIVSDCFATFPTLPYQDDTYLSKPVAGSDWLHFHDLLSSRVFSNQDWELGAYLSTPVLAFHHLFASTSRHSYASASTNTSTIDTQETKADPFTGPRASYEAHEATKANHAALQHLHTSLSLQLTRTFRGPNQVAEELLPYLLRMLSPDVKPVVVGGSESGVASVRRGAEKEMVRRAVDAMIACGVTFEQARIDLGEAGVGGAGHGGFVYRMEPGLDALGVFQTLTMLGATAKTRYAVRQVLDQEFRREVIKREGGARVRRMRGDAGDVDIIDVAAEEEKNGPKELVLAKASEVKVKRDFFGRPIVQKAQPDGSPADAVSIRRSSTREGGDRDRIWVSHREGYSNAVRKGITLKELLEGM